MYTLGDTNQGQLLGIGRTTLKYTFTPQKLALPTSAKVIDCFAGLYYTILLTGELAAPLSLLQGPLLLCDPIAITIHHTE